MGITGQITSRYTQLQVISMALSIPFLANYSNIIAFSSTKVGEYLII